MKKIEELRRHFTKGERALWFGSVFVIIAAFYFFDRSNYFTLFASLLGVTSLIFNAKGNPFGQLLMILFSLLYGIISFTFSYYGEMLTYVGMTMPMAVFALISWLKNRLTGTGWKSASITWPEQNGVLCIWRQFLSLRFFTSYWGIFKRPT